MEKIQFDSEIPGVQKQVELEITKVHPLFRKTPIVIGRRIDNDDVLTRLSDGSYASVHLVWGSGPEAFPEDYPSFQLYSSLQEFLAVMDIDAEDYEE
ncbi:hypothetical protein KIH87_17440 [Paraneptunicella aestuarii]|uniref:hypothetical protein n=1 Tax=Paraneptunicella aestuarii TaxID=2831148 RepID=UPI001E49FCAA|nr:hypothetical protein [Paraneptunicella aestuarii]UAA38440.1 hypothetical protein KIH87_17440 [Paraneptunicella aestuarii]